MCTLFFTFQVVFGLKISTTIVASLVTFLVEAKKSVTEEPFQCAVQDWLCGLGIEIERYQRSLYLVNQQSLNLSESHISDQNRMPKYFGDQKYFGESVSL